MSDLKDETSYKYGRGMGVSLSLLPSHEVWTVSDDLLCYTLPTRVPERLLGRDVTKPKVTNQK